MHPKIRSTPQAHKLAASQCVFDDACGREAGMRE